MGLKLTSDPTRTKTLRDEYACRLRGHYRKIRAEVREKVGYYLKFAQGASVALSEANINNALDDYRAWLLKYLETARAAFIDRTADFYLRTAYSRGLERAATELGKYDISISSSWDLLDEQAYKNLLDLTGGLLEKLDNELAGKVLYVIRQGVLEGWGIRKIAVAIKDVSEFTLKRAETIARTEIIRAYNRAALNRYSRYTDKVIWRAAIDERTCDQCAALDGQIIPISQLTPPPLHPRCRCTVIPYFER